MNNKLKTYKKNIVQLKRIGKVKQTQLLRGGGDIFLVFNGWVAN